LDVLLRPISQEMETSYSAPFARYLFDKEMVNDEQGGIKWVSAKLQYVNPVSITGGICKGVFTGLIIWLIASAILWSAKINLRNLKVGWITFGLVISLLSVCWYLMQDYHIFGTDKIGQ